VTDLDAEKPHVELLPASLEQQPILANLLELYIHDFSEFLPLELRSDGRFGYSNLSAYWRDPEGHPDRHPFLVRVDGNLAGFVLIKRGSGISGDASVWDMAEFFIVRGHRRHGIATKIAHDVWSRFPGRWEVRVMESNQPARSFWEHAIHQFTGQTTPSACVQINAQNWHVFSFESRQD
jgi:predicted acetyltransferase